MNRLLIASGLGNLVLVAVTWFLFSTNSSLNIKKGEQAATISTYADTNAKLGQQVTACVSTQKQLVIEHGNQIRDLQNTFASIENANRSKIEALVRNQGKFQQVLAGIKMPEPSKTCEGRIANINKMVDSYISEIKR